MDNYVVYHLHSDLSNGVTNIDSVTKFGQYIDAAKACGMKALGFSEKIGNIRLLLLSILVGVHLNRVLVGTDDHEEKVAFRLVVLGFAVVLSHQHA